MSETPRPNLATLEEEKLKMEIKKLQFEIEKSEAEKGKIQAETSDLKMVWYKRYQYWVAITPVILTLSAFVFALSSNFFESRTHELNARQKELSFGIDSLNQRKDSLSKMNDLLLRSNIDLFHKNEAFQNQLSGDSVKLDSISLKNHLYRGISTQLAAGISDKNLELISLQKRVSALDSINKMAMKFGDDMMAAKNWAIDTYGGYQAVAARNADSIDRLNVRVKRLEDSLHKIRGQ